MYVGTERRQLAACRRVMQRSINGLVEGLTQYRFDQTRSSTGGYTQLGRVNSLPVGKDKAGPP